MNDLQVIEEKFIRCPNCRSFSVKQTDDFSFKESMKGLFVPAAAFTCNNCGFRYIELGQFSTSLRHLITGEGKRKWVVVAIPIMVVVIIVALFVLPGNQGLDEPGEKPLNHNNQVVNRHFNNQKPPDDQKPTDDQKPPDDQKPTDNQKPPGDQKHQPSNNGTANINEEPVGIIEIGNSNRYGVNWTVVENGVAITRISPGPLKAAGLQVGDILNEVAGRRVSDGNYMLAIRDEVFTGKRNEVLVKVYRNGKLLLFRMVKFAKK